MENEIIKKSNGFEIPIPIAIIIAGAMLSAAWMYNSKLKVESVSQRANIAEVKVQKSPLEEKVLPSQGVELPVVWGDLGVKLVKAGVIDGEKFKALYEGRGEFTKDYEKLLFGNNESKIKITEENAGYLLNLFWALGLAQDNPILSDKTEMANPKYAGGDKRPAEGFASTAGWTMSMGDPMNHYSRHKFFDLTAQQQMLVDKISRGIYRPCCNNSTHFPDCNHGMAMLGLLELMASQGASEKDMWQAALAVNAYWFPDTYITIATYMKNKKGIEWSNVNPQEMLGVNFSSASGFTQIASQVSLPSNSRSGGGCGVDTVPSTSAPSPRQPSGCGI